MYPLRSMLLLLLSTLVTVALSAQTQAAPAAVRVGLLQAGDMASLMPATVFFRGQVASVQARNAAGVKMQDGMFVLCALVDTSGYSTSVQQKYQAYFITEVALDIDGQKLKPGAYGAGFVTGNQFLLMDLGAHDLITVASGHDAEMKRPTPLQVLDDTTAGHYRLYINRNYVVFARAAQP